MSSPQKNSNRHFIAFVLLLLTYLTAPFLEHLHLDNLRSIGTYAVTGYLAWTLDLHRWLRRSVWILVGLALLSILARSFNHGILFSESFLAILLFSVVTYASLRHIFSQTKSNSETIFAALTTFILMGFSWAMIHILVARLSPDQSYNFYDPALANTRFSEFTYFSFTTLTTLGYGDYLPLSHISKMFSTLEAILGQIYLAVLVGRLVGLQVASSTKESDAPPQDPTPTPTPTPTKSDRNIP